MSNNSLNQNDLDALLQSAVDDNVISEGTSNRMSQIAGTVGQGIIAGANGAAIDSLGSSRITLVSILLDASGSMASATNDVLAGYNALVDALRDSKASDDILLSLRTFNDNPNLIHSYLPLEDVPVLGSEYNAHGVTALYQSWYEALSSNVAYAQQLADEGNQVQSIVLVISDGDDNRPRISAQDCYNLAQDLLRHETFTLAFIGAGYSTDFEKIAKSMGIPKENTMLAGNLDATGWRNLFQTASKSIIRASAAGIAPQQASQFF